MRNAYASGSWTISDIQCKCDLLTLDNPRGNEYASHLLSGKSLPINFATWSHTNQSTGIDKNNSVRTLIVHYLVLNLYLSLLNHTDTMQYEEANNFFTIQFQPN